MNTQTTVKLLRLLLATLALVAIASCSSATRREADRTHAPVLTTSAAPMSPGSPMAAPAVDQKPEPRVSSKSRPAPEPSLEELTDLSPENIPAGAPCRMVNGKLRCKPCDRRAVKKPRP